MKKNLFTILFLILGFISFHTHAITIQGYIGVNEPYKFNLPIQGLGMSMPTGTGFIVPFFSGEGVFLDMNDDVNYFLPVELLEEKSMFKFSLTSSDNSFLKLDIIPTKKFFSNTYLTNISRSYESFQKIQQLKNDLGKSTSYSIEKNKIKTDFHVFFYDGNLYEFSIPSSVSDKAKYEAIIRSLKKKIFQKEIAAYEERQKSAYYNNKESEQDIIDTADEPELRTLYGLSKKNQKLYFPQEGISYTLPKDYYYEINARKIIDTNDGLEIYRADSDKKENFFLNWNRGPQGWVIFRSKFKKGDEESNYFSDMGSGGKMVYNYSKDFDIIIDGVKGGGTFYGSPFCGTVELWFENDNAYLSFMLNDVSTDNISFYEKLLSSIKIDHKSKQSKNKEGKSLSSILSLENKPEVALSELDVEKSLASNLNGFLCSFVTTDIKTYLPGNPEDYTYGIMTNWGEDILQLNDKGETLLAPSQEALYVAIRSEKPDYTVSLNLYFNYGKDYSVEQTIEGYITAWGSVKSQPPYKIAGILTAEDGSKWGVYIQSSEKEAVIFGGNKKYNIYYTISATSTEQLYRILAMLYKFKTQ